MGAAPRSPRRRRRPLSPRRPTPDPLEVARALIDEAARATCDEWKRSILSSARMKLEEARAGITDGEEALKRYSSPVSDMMRSSVEARRRQIDELAARITAEEGSA